MKTSTVNVATHLADLAARRPHALAVACPAGRDRAGRTAYTHLTFARLHEESDLLAHGFQRIGVGRGTRTVLMTPPSLEFFALTFALFKLGAVPVFVDPGMGVRNLGRCLGEADPTAFIGIPKAHAARVLLGWARGRVRITVTTGRSRFTARHTLAELRRLGEAARQPFPQAATTADETAAVLFTSGSTGIAKGAVYTHGIFAAQVEALRTLYTIDPGEVDLTTFPLFALFGPALGMTAIIPEMDPTRPARVDPRKVIEAVRDWGVTNLFGSPALLNRVGRYGAEQGVRLSTLRRVISAGAPVPAAVIERFTKLLPPGVQVFTPYGATESLPVASIGSDEVIAETRHATNRGAGVCVGRPAPNMTVRVIRVTDDPIPTWDDDATPLHTPGEVGEITVKGPVVTAAYFGRPEATARAKIADPRGGVWHRMGDLGYLDATGRLWFCGRKAHRVVTPAGTFDTIPCEAVFNTHPHVYRTALVGVRRGDAVEPVLCVELEAGSRGVSHAAVERELLEIAARHNHTRAIRHILFHPSFPVDVRHNAKIFREKLAAWAAGRL
jgi:acyl-CoA synthetase (AMP-forming)/AMP-acid ligase II